MRMYRWKIQIYGPLPRRIQTVSFNYTPIRQFWMKSNGCRNCFPIYRPRWTHRDKWGNTSFLDPRISIYSNKSPNLWLGELPYSDFCPWIPKNWIRPKNCLPHLWMPVSGGGIPLFITGDWIRRIFTPITFEPILKRM